MVQRFLCGANNMIRVLRTGNLIRNSKLSRIMREDLLKCRECTRMYHCVFWNNIKEKNVRSLFGGDTVLNIVHLFSCKFFLMSWKTIVTKSCSNCSIEKICVPITTLDKEIVSTNLFWKVQTLPFGF